MKFSLSWIGDYVELPERVSEATERLTAAGLAVEEVLEVDGDTVLDIDVTTNRPDCMNHFGLARELAVLLDRPLKAPAVEPLGPGTGAPIEVELEDPTGCPRYAAVALTGVKVGPSPDWLATRLTAVGVRPINNLVDVTNYVLWETGQPLHAFDAKTLRGGKIVVRSARENEELVTLDGERRKLDPGILVIADAERAVALAGIMGGAETEVSDATVDVLIESAHFDRGRVRKGARQLGLATDASHRFERGSDPQGCLDAAVRAARLMVELAGGEVVEPAVDVAELEPLALGRRGSLDLDRLDAFTGVELPAADVERWLAGLGFEPESNGERRLEVTIPGWRHFDFEPAADGSAETADLFEEPMRIFGFESVPSALPALGAPDAGDSGSYLLRERVREVLAASGMAEAITFSFHGRAASDGLPCLEVEGDSLALANPVSEQYAVMRRSLLPGLIDSAVYNQRRGAESVGLFELGRVFPGGEAAELEAVALVAGGASAMPWDREPEMDLFDLKGVADALAAAFGLELTARPAALPGLMADTACELLEGDRVVGSLGQLELDDAPYPLYVSEMRGDLFETAPGVARVRVPSRHPAIAADLTLTHSAEVSWRRLTEAIRESAPAELSDFRLKDRYEGEGVPAGAVNTTVHFVYRAEDRSLTQEEVNESHGGLAERLRRDFEWTKSG